MAGQRRLHRHLGRFQIADLAHHDDVRVLAHQRADAVGKAQIDGRLHLHLVEAVFHHLDRVLDGGHVHLLGGQRAQRGVERRGLARAGRSGHQHDTVGARRHFLPARQIVALQAQLGKAARQHRRVEHPHHQLFAKGGGQRRQPQLHLVAIGGACLDPPVLRTAALHHVHAAQQLDAAGHRRHHVGRHLIDVVEDAVDAQPHHAHVAARLQVNVAGTLLEGVLPQPVHQRDDVLVIGIEIATIAPQLDQLLEIALQAATAILLLRTAHRAGQLEELHQIALQIQRTGQHRHHLLAQRVRQLGHPIGEIRLGRGDHHRIGAHFQWQDAVTAGIGLAHHLAHPREIHLQRIDAHMAHAHVRGQPGAQPVHVQQRMRRQQGPQLPLGDHHQRMAIGRRQAGVAAQPRHLLGRHVSFLAQQPQQAVEPQPPARFTRCQRLLHPLCLLRHRCHLVVPCA